MSRILALAALLLALAAPLHAGAESAPPRNDAEGAELYLYNRHITSLHATRAGYGPATRVERARQRFAALDGATLRQPVTVSPLPNEEGGLRLGIGDVQLFALVRADLDPEDHVDLAQAMERARTRVQEAVAARLAQREPATLLRGAAIALGVLLGWMLVFAIGLRLYRHFDGLCRQYGGAEDADAALPMQPVAYFHLARYRLAAAGVWLLVIGATYVAALLALAGFPWTLPWSQQLGAFVADLGGWLLSGTMAAIPGLITVAIVMFIARTVQDTVNLLFRQVQNGLIRLPFMHADTVGATRRLFTVLVWGLAVAVAYPFLPGSSSDAFKGLSVLFGLMLTLGSTGVVTQLMGGLVVVYSRSLKRGDFVAVNGVEGVVSEVGALAVKIVNMRNEEITLPNSLITASPIHNYSKLSGAQGTLISTGVTIGYDTPWRQVHAMLVAAAEKTPGVRATPAPFVFQRNLSDFYVEYELFAHIDKPLERISILSALLAAIQDEFNRYGVQIMSPHFYQQPAQSQVVPPDQWYAAPARAPED